MMAVTFAGRIKWMVVFTGCAWENRAAGTAAHDDVAQGLDAAV
jgi:hypothetical protein